MNPLNDFIAGDYVTGKSTEFWKRIGKVSEKLPVPGGTFIFIDWLDGTTERVRKSALKRTEPPADPTPAIIPERPRPRYNQPPKVADIVQNEEAMVEDDHPGGVSDSSSDDESEDDDHDENDDTDNSEGDDDNPPEHHIPFQAGIPNAGPGGAGGGGRGGGGRVARERYVPPPLPSPLHAYIDRGTHNRLPTYQVWAAEETVFDPSNGYPKHDHSMSLNWQGKMVFSRGLVPPVQEREFIHYYLLMFPLPYIQVILDSTNNQLLLDNRNNKAMTKHEFFVYKAIRIATALRPIDGPIKEYWDKVPPEDDDIFPAFDFESKFGMSYTRFKTLTNCLRLAEYTALTLSVDPYLPIDGFIEAFNDRRRKVVNPGRDVIVDECMSSWRGDEMVLAHESVMHVTKIQRKPKSVGVEFKGVADGDSHILLQLEIQKAKGENERKPFADQFPFHVAIVLRLCAYWFGSGRRVIGDAAFSSLLTCTALLANGLFYLGIVKTATKGFCVEYCKSWEASNPVRGTHKAISTTVEVLGVPRKVISALWCSKKDHVKKVIGTCSTTLPGEPIIVQRSKRVQVQVEEADGGESDEDIDEAPAAGIWVTQKRMVPTNRPKIVQDLFRDFGTIDLHDRYRQGILRLEIAWRTRSMWQRLFATIEGMIVTDAYLAWIYDLKKQNVPSKDIPSFRKACQKLIKSMIQVYAPSNRPATRQQQQEPAAEIPVPTLLPLGADDRVCCSNSECYKLEKGTTAAGRKRRRKAGGYCSACSDPENDDYVACCDLRTHRNCWLLHLQEYHNTSQLPNVDLATFV
jgi:hypothetical protein